MNHAAKRAELPAFGAETTPDLEAEAERYADTLAPGDEMRDEDIEHCWRYLHLLPAALIKRGMVLEHDGKGRWFVRKSAAPCNRTYHAIVKRERATFRALTRPMGVQVIDEFRIELGRCVHCGSTLAVMEEP